MLTHIGPNGGAGGTTLGGNGDKLTSKSLSGWWYDWCTERYTGTPPLPSLYGK